MGVFDDKLTRPIAKVLAALGAVRAMVVHAADGLDEISTTSETHICELTDGQVSSRTVKPEDFGLPRATLDDLGVDSAEQSAEMMHQVLDGAKGAARDIVVLNAAAALAVADRAETIAQAIPIAEQSIDSGAGKKALRKLIEVSKS